ncbi:MAG: RraA family protein [Stellaceae bacterium]
MDSQAPTSADIHPGPGFRVMRTIERTEANLLDCLREFAVTDISDHLNRLYGVGSSIHCLSGAGRSLVGPACTVKVYPGDNLMVHKTLDIAAPGDVVVVDAGGSIQNAVLGDTISMKARHRGIAGFIVDGYVRDLDAVREFDFPVYARGETLIGPLHRGPGEINYPVCCGGVVVSPGDAVIADTSGIVIVPRAYVEVLLAKLGRHKDRMTTYLAAVRQGKFSNGWVDRQLEEQRCELIG